MSRRIAALAVAVACLLLASGHLTAQLPDSKKPTPPTPEQVARRHIEMIQLARDQLLNKYTQAQQEYSDFQVNSPVLFASKIGTPELLARQLAKVTAARQDLRQRQDELTARAQLVKDVGDSDAKARVLLVYLQRRGVDVETLRRIGGGDTFTPVPLVRLYGDSLEQEAKEVQYLLQLADERITQDEREIKKMRVYEVKEEQLRDARDQTKRLLDVVTRQIETLDLMKELRPGQKP